jgi:hypothetical protein
MELVNGSAETGILADAVSRPEISRFAKWDFGEEYREQSACDDICCVVSPSHVFL